MDIDSQNFQKQLPKIINHIAKADFISFDCQFSGLTSQLGEIQGIFPNHVQFYERIKQTANNFSILQFGISTFQFKQDSYKPQIFNFYLYPKTKTHNKNQVMLSQVQSLKFLADKKMDFHKIFTKGIKHKRINQKQDDPVFKTSTSKFSYKCMFFDEGDQKIVNEIQNSIFIPFLKSNEKEININFHSQSIVIYFRNKYSPNIQITNKLKKMKEFQFNARKSKNFIFPVYLFENKQQMKMQIQQQQYNNNFDQSPSFEIIISKIIEYQKPLVGHFPNLDLGLFFSHFLRDLPDTFEKFCQIVNTYFPYFFDTKVISKRLQSVVKGHINVSLKPLFQQCLYGKILKPYTNINFEGLNEYIKKDNLHEAGYDSFMTGVAFIGMINYLENQKARIKFQELNSVNKILFSRNTGQVSLIGPVFCERSIIFEKRIIIGQKVKQNEKNDIARILSKFGTLSLYQDHDQYYYFFECDKNINEIIQIHKGLKLLPYSKRRIIRANKTFSQQ